MVVCYVREVKLNSFDVTIFCGNLNFFVTLRQTVKSDGKRGVTWIRNIDATGR